MLKNWPDNINYILFVDESGTEGLNNIDLNYPIMVLCGCLIDKENYQFLKKYFQLLKKEFWPPNGKFKNKDVCLISNHIRREKGPFGPQFLSKETKSNFYEKLNDIIQGVIFQIFASIIDKKKLCEKYRNPVNPYNIAFKFIIERAIYNCKNKKMLIVIESRGKKENKNLISIYDDFKNNGTEFVNPYQFKKTINDIKFLPKWSSEGEVYSGIELADLCAYPIGTSYLGRINKASEIIIPKIFNYPEHLGYGLKIFP